MAKVPSAAITLPLHDPEKSVLLSDEMRIIAERDREHNNTGNICQQVMVALRR
jgi:hypothetical protein